MLKGILRNLPFHLMRATFSKIPVKRLMSLGFVSALLAGCSSAGVTITLPDFLDHSVDHKLASCGASHGHGMEGKLTANFDATDTLIGWSCNINSHMNCNASAQGVWVSCDFPPDVMAWPDPVPKKALTNAMAYKFIPMPADSAPQSVQ